MLPTKLVSEKGLSEVDEINVNKCSKTGVQTLRVAAIYGANGSGKSNVIKALEFMKKFVINSSRLGQRGDKISTEPFLLDKSGRSEPSGFEVVFTLKGTRYRYGFEATQEAIISEWLYYVPNVREANIFDREGESVKISKKFESSFLEIYKFTRSNALFISVLAQFNVKLADDIVEWFNNINFVEPNKGGSYFNPERSVYGNSEIRKGIAEFLNVFDIDIENLEYEEKNWDKEPIFKSFTKSVQDLFEGSPIRPNSVTSIHNVFDEEGNIVDKIGFDLDSQESDGTRKLISVLPIIMAAIAREEIAVIDEMDARLHPVLTAALIKMFQSHESDSCAQLIITTHDTNILSKENFRRDQIWFTEKNKRGISELYSLAEIQSRNDGNYEDNYLNGRYGAIPYINKSKLMEI